MSTFDDFPGRSRPGNDLYEFPVLYSISKRGKARFWAQFVRIVKSTGEAPVTEQNWNLMAFNTVPIDKNILDLPDLPSGDEVQVWAEGGELSGKVSRHAPSVFNKSMNKGRANQRNAFYTALIAARSAWEKRRRGGASVTRPLDGAGTSHVTSNAAGMAYMQLAVNQKFIGNIEYPCLAQPKLDGLRMGATIKAGAHAPYSTEDVLLYSRGLKPYDQVNKEYLREEILKILIDMQNDAGEHVVLDGELYEHGKSLQAVMSMARGSSTAPMNLQYHVFDCFYPSRRLDNLERVNLMEQHMVEDTDKPCVGAPWVRRVTTILLQEKEVGDMFKMYTDMNYEGIMLRNQGAKYALCRNNSTRNNNLVKMKNHFSDEFKCVGFLPGAKGKYQNSIIWMCAVPDSTLVFKVTPKNMPMSESRALLTRCQANNGEGFNEFAGRLLKCEYQDVRKDGVPLRAKSVGFRDAGER